MKLSGTDWKEIREAFCDAFPSRREMGRLVNDYFGKNINEIVSYDSNLKDIADDIIQWFTARDAITELVNSAFTERPNHAATRKLAQKWNQIPTLPEEDHLERIVRQANSFLDPEIWYAKFRDIINQVCQIEIKTSGGGKSFGSGVLIAPDIILTNYHVVECIAEPEKHRRDGLDATPSDVIIRFDNRKGTSGYIQPGIEFQLKNDWLISSSPYQPADSNTPSDWESLTENELDYALLRVEGSPGKQDLASSPGGNLEIERGWVKLNQRISSGVIGMGLIIVQHPEGEALKVGVETEAVLDISPLQSRIKHKVNTMKGSSGAPCFNFNWDLAAIHQAGIPPTDTTAGYNIAIPISKIITSLEKKGLTNSGELIDG